MKTIEIKVYQFDELSEEGQQKAIENYFDINVDHDWWEFNYDDAKNVGLKIKGFDLDRGNYCKIDPIWEPSEIKKAVLNTHGKDCDTYKTVKKYDLRKEGEGEEMLKELAEDYLKLLRQEYEWRTSKEQIIETLKINEYHFTENGKIYPV
jgi:hypothetical protein